MAAPAVTSTSSRCILATFIYLLKKQQQLFFTLNLFTFYLNVFQDVLIFIMCWKEYHILKTFRAVAISSAAAMSLLCGDDENLNLYKMIEHFLNHIYIKFSKILRTSRCYDALPLGWGWPSCSSSWHLPRPCRPRASCRWAGWMCPWVLPASAQPTWATCCQAWTENCFCFFISLIFNMSMFRALYVSFWVGLGGWGGGKPDRIIKIKTLILWEGWGGRGGVAVSRTG